MVPIGDLETGPEPLELLQNEPPASTLQVDPAMLAAQLPHQEIALLDFADSRTYKHGHIAGAWFTVRSQIQSCLGRIPDAPEYVLTSPCGLLATLATSDVAKHQARIRAGGVHHARVQAAARPRRLLATSLGECHEKCCQRRTAPP